MKIRKIATPILFMLLFALLASPLQSAMATTPQEPMDSMVLTMSTDDIKIFDGAITIGEVALMRGHKVSMLLRLDSIKPALKSGSYPVGDTTLAKRLMEFMTKGATVIVGGKCMKKMQLKPTDLLEGIEIGTPERVMGILFEKDAKILSY